VGGVLTYISRVFPHALAAPPGKSKTGEFSRHLSLSAENGGNILPSYLSTTTCTYTIHGTVSHSRNSNIPLEDPWDNGRSKKKKKKLRYNYDQKVAEIFAEQ
jgi:hypothetical protein